MATLEVVNNFLLTSQGLVKSGKQGLAAGAFTDAFTISVQGQCHNVTGSLATASVWTVYDDDNDTPIDFVYLFYWSDQDSYIQIIGSASNAIFKVAAYEPFVISGYDVVLAAANVTPITGGAEPSVTDIDSIVIGNYSGSTMNFVFAVVL